MKRLTILFALVLTFVIPTFAQKSCLQTAICGARSNAERTDYKGKASLLKAIGHAEKVLEQESNIHNINAETARLRRATEKYLSHRPSQWVTIQNGKLWPYS